MAIDCLTLGSNHLAMLTKANVDRIDLSEHVISGWEATGRPIGTVAELLRLIDAECAKLEELGPTASERVTTLLTRYKDLADRLRAQIA